MIILLAKICCRKNLPCQNYSDCMKPFLVKHLTEETFKRKSLRLDILERLEERKVGGAHKAPFLYRFDQKKYERAMKHGLKFGLQ